MNKLPPEILAHIIASGLDDDANLAQYSTISRAWKASIERLTFRELTITTDELDAFVALFDGDNIARRTHLAKLIVNFILPVPPNAHGCCAVESPPDRGADSAALSSSIAKLFAILAALADRSIDKPPLSLCFNNGCRRTKSHELRISSRARCWTIPGISRGKHSSRETREAQAMSGEIEFLHDTIIPTVRGVQEFEHVGIYDLEDLKPTWIPSIVARLPDLVRLRLGTLDSYEYGRLKRMERKDCFVSSICSLPSDHLREIRISSSSLFIGNEHIPVHKLVDEGNYSHEPWFRMVSHFASFSNLMTLQLHGGLVVCPEFFRAIIDYPGTPFSSLVEFELQFGPQTADGRWYFLKDEDAIERTRRNSEWDEFWREQAMADRHRVRKLRRNPPSEDSDHNQRIYEDGPFRTSVMPYDTFRSRPNPDTFSMFLLDAAAAVERFPSLKKFILKLGHSCAGPTQLRDSPVVSRVFELWYLRAGMPRSPRRDPLDFSFSNPYVPGDAAYVNQDRLYWRINNAEIWEEIQAAWTAIAGPDAKIVYMDEDRWMKNSWTNDIPVGYMHGYEGEL